jgi:acyl-coenzyme A synthetase/AMP-(fatty) acid ligase
LLSLIHVLEWRVTVVAELPRNATGKVLRAALRQPFWAGRDRQVS